MELKMGMFQQQNMISSMQIYLNECHYQDGNMILYWYEKLADGKFCIKKENYGWRGDWIDMGYIIQWVEIWNWGKSIARHLDKPSLKRDWFWLIITMMFWGWLIKNFLFFNILFYKYILLQAKFNETGNQIRVWICLNLLRTHQIIFKF